MSGRGDAVQLRQRNDEDRQSSTRQTPDRPSGSSSMVAVTQTVTTYPTVAGRAYALKWASIKCAQTEGAIPTFTTQGSNFFGVNLGAVIPPNGTAVEIDMKDGLYVFTYG